MFRKICNYMAVLSLSLIVGGGSILANPVTLRTTTKAKTIVVDNNKNFFNDVLLSGGKHSYSIKVGAGKEVKIRIRASRGVELKLQTPYGEVKKYSPDKYFDISLRTEGEYSLELDSLFISQYSLEVFNR